MPELVCPAGDPRWREERRRGVTATDITAIIGLSPYESAYSLWAKKTGLVPDEHADSDRLRLGRELEPIISARFSEQKECGPLSDGALFRSSARPWQMATIDRAYLGEPAELKSWADIDRDAWADGPPPLVRAQVLWQMDTLDVDRGHVGVLFLPSGEFRSYVIEHELDWCHSEDLGGFLSVSEIGSCPVCVDLAMMRDAARDFLEHVQNGPAPALDGSDATLAALRARFTPAPGKEAEIDELLWDEYQNVCGIAVDVAEEKRLLEAKIRDQAGEGKILTVGGVKVGVRVTGESQVKAHTRRQDYIRRSARKGEGDGE